MSESKDNQPAAANEFAEAASPSLRDVLLGQISLIKTGELKTVGRTEWDRGVDELERQFDRSRTRFARREI